MCKFFLEIILDRTINHDFLAYFYSRIMYCTYIELLKNNGFNSYVESLLSFGMIFRTFSVWAATIRPYFSTNPTFVNPLKNPTSYLVEAGF